jgi:Fur family peroxide stress response transcriptional regulator
MAETVEDSVMERFIDRCRREGLKVTPQRIAIYEALLGMNNHPSADFVYRKMSALHPTISFDTVNRTLQTFAEIGVIDIVESYSGARRFDTDTLPHHHLHCVRCGGITDFHDKDLDDVRVPDGIFRTHRVLGKRLVVSCICPECGEID